MSESEVTTRKLPIIPPPTVWEDTHRFTCDDDSRIQDFDRTHGKQMEKLKEMVKEWLIDEAHDVSEKINFINLIERLGVSYHFELEVDEQLNQIFKYHIDGNEYDLYTTGLLFRILRQHGYKMSSSCFHKFMDNKKSLVRDAKGILSLYEATFLRVHGEDVVEEALAFSQTHLKSLAEQTSPHMSNHILNALELPLHKCMPRLETLKFITFYGQEEDKNESLLLFAKLDFNRVQLLYRQEIKEMVRWWKDLDWPTKLPFVRDRIIEAHFWAILLYFEPCYSRARIMLSKINMLQTMIDDTYDSSYGTYQELALLTESFKRWEAVPDLPEKMEFIFNTFLHECDKIVHDLGPNEKSYKASYTKIASQIMFAAYAKEAEWCHKKHVPSFAEYLQNGIRSFGCTGYPAATYIGMDEEIADINAFEWMINEPKILQAAYAIGRLKNDIIGHKSGERRDHILCGVECLIKEGLSMEEVNEKYEKLIIDAWKDMNEECLKALPVSKAILVPIVNFGRLIEVTYKDGDAYTFPEKIKEVNIALFIDQISL